MRMNRKAALATGASLAVAFLAACSDSPTSPTANVVVPKTNFAIGDITNGPAPEAAPGVIIVCKTGNVGGSFVFTRTTEGPNVDPAGGVTSNQTIATGKCLEVARDNSPSGSGSHITITEQSAPNTTFSITACRFRGYALDGVTLNPPEDCVYTNGGDLFLNHFHGFVITYNNVFTEPPSGCTYTKGWYQSKNATLTGVDGLTTTMEAAFFAATPNNTGSVSFVGPNNLLNLYQQLLAALENGGAAGPAAVQQAITDAQNGTSVDGTGKLTTTLTNTQISALIVTLTAFNEGTYEGWPHC
jgi:hypothetical protein